MRNATHYRTVIKVVVTDTVRYYTTTDAADATEARRKAVAEATVDYGFLNVGIKVMAVQVWNFDTKAWDDVDGAEADAPEAPAAPAPKLLDQMTTEEKDAELSQMWVDSNGGMLPYFGFFGGGPASVKSKNYLRVLLRRHAGRREAELIRWSLNDQREHGDTITRSDVIPAIKILKAL